MLNNNFPLRDKGVSNALELDSLPRHRWYFIKEGFSPKLIEQAVATEGVRRGELLFDPFSGSGTAPLTGALAGLKVHASEINPFLGFLSAAKLTHAKPAAFKKEIDKLLRATKRSIPSALEGYSTFTEPNRWDRWFFPTDVLRRFEAGRQALYRARPESRNLLRLALLGAIMDCCNANRDGKCLRYSKEWKQHQAKPEDFRKRLEERAEMITNDLDAAPLADSVSRITQGDVRALLKRRSRERFRLCITSPPYLNSFDYSDVYRPELFLGRFVKSNKSLMKIRVRTVRSHVQARWDDPVREDFGTQYSDCISLLQDHAEQLWNPRIPIMVQAYFEDMEDILKGLRRRALDNASLWLVVSTSAYGGVEIPVDLILAELGQRNGWFLREVGVLRYLRSSSQHVEHVTDENRKSVPLRESVVIFDATKPKTMRTAILRTEMH
jgi:hypothetical protein